MRSNKLLNLVFAALVSSSGVYAHAEELKKDDKPAADKAADDSVVNPYGKAFVGEGVEIEMALFSKKNKAGLQDVLLKITGGPAHDEGIDGKVIKYTTEPAGTGVNFNFPGNAKEKGYTRMISRASWGDWSFFEVYIGDKTYSVYLDEAKSKDVRPLHLLTAYNKDNK